METLLLQAAKREETQHDIDNLKAKYNEDINIGVVVSHLVTFSVVTKTIAFSSQKDKDVDLHVCVLNIHKSRLDKLILVNVANHFTDLNKLRNRNFGCFNGDDF